MKFKSALVTQASGSAGGATFAHNSGGLYMRARSIPTNPSTAFQTAVRNILSGLSQAWSATLTTAQRTAWDTYATNVPLIGPLGDSRKVGGLAMYIRCNTPRVQAGLSSIAAAPTIFTLGTFTNPTLTITASTGLISVAFTNTDLWASATTGALLVYSSRPQSVGINFFKGPYRLAGKIVGATVPPTSPVSVTSPFTLTAGQKVFVQIQATLPDGRLSAAFRAGGTVV